MLGIGRLIDGFRLSRSYVRALNRARAELLDRLAAGPLENENMTIHELVRKCVEPVLAQHPTLTTDMRPILRARAHLQEAIRQWKEPLGGSSAR
jgi:hypothetical protein